VAGDSDRERDKGRGVMADEERDVDAQIAALRKWFRIEQEADLQGVHLTLYPYRVTVTAPTYGFACSKLIRVMEGRFATELATLKDWLREESRRHVAGG